VKKRSKNGGGSMFKDIEARTLSEAVGAIAGVKPPDGSGHQGNVLLEMSGHVAVLSTAAQPRDFLIKIAVTPAAGGTVPVAIAQNSTILQPGGYAQFTLLTVHQNPPQGTYRMLATIEARIPGGVPEPIDGRQVMYRVL
jgi:hypothetical protein